MISSLAAALASTLGLLGLLLASLGIYGMVSSTRVDPVVALRYE